MRIQELYVSNTDPPAAFRCFELNGDIFRFEFARVNVRRLYVRLYVRLYSRSLAILSDTSLKFQRRRPADPQGDPCPRDSQKRAILIFIMYFQRRGNIGFGTRSIREIRLRNLIRIQEEGKRKEKKRGGRREIRRTLA